MSVVPSPSRSPMFATETPNWSPLLSTGPFAVISLISTVFLGPNCPAANALLTIPSGVTDVSIVINKIDDNNKLENFLELNIDSFT